MKNLIIILLNIIALLFLFYILPVRMLPEESPNKYLFYYITIFISSFSYYLNYFGVLPKITKNPRPLKIILGIVVIFLFHFFLKFIIQEILIIEILKFKDNESPFPISFFIFTSLFEAFAALLFSSFIWFINNTFKVEKERQELLLQKNEAEMSLLKSQINPHFIFNTLNNIYSLVNQKSDKSLDAIEKLGDLLRFSSTEIKKDFTSLGNEIKYLKNYIDLESLRISTPENIIFEDKTENKNLEIAPMILIPFLENAFKHGNLKDSKLEISIKTIGSQIYFHQKNKISKAEKDKSSGIGIENVKERLSIIYPDKHLLEILNNKDFYEVNLTINL